MTPPFFFNTKAFGYFREVYQYIYAWKPRWYKCREKAWLETKGNKWEILVTQARIPKGKQKGKDLKECGNIFILFTTLSPAPSTSYAFRHRAGTLKCWEKIG